MTWRCLVDKYDWDRLNGLQVGRYAEYFVKMEFTLRGFDVYSPEVDYRGIDFVVRRGDDDYFDVQVKSVRMGKGRTPYIFFPKDRFPLRDKLLAAVVLFHPGEPPRLYLIPASAWREPNGLFVDHEYPGLKSKPEYGLNISKRHQALLDSYAFDHSISHL